MLEPRGVTKRFGALTAVEDLTFAASPGELVAIVGSSGSGTILSLIAGLNAIVLLTVIGLVLYWAVGLVVKRVPHYG